MLHIAICDDNSLALDRIVRLLEDYRKQTCAPVSWRTFLSASELVSSMRTEEYGLLLLDILMPGVSGMEAARAIRTFNPDVKIVFLTASPDYAVEGYAVNAADYLLKPVNRDRFYRLMDRLVAEEYRRSESIHIKTASGAAKILLSALSYVEVRDKVLYFHLNDGSVRQSRAALAEYEPNLLSRGNFLKVHRSYIVNLWHMSELTADSFITFGGETIPISRLLYSQARQMYMDYLFAEAESL